MILQVFDNSDYSNWRLVVMFFIVSLMLLIANILRRRVKLFRNLLFPTAIIAGFIGLGVKYLLFGLNAQVGGQDILSNVFLNSVTYHTIALGFIAMGLKTVKKDDSLLVSTKVVSAGRRMICLTGEAHNEKAGALISTASSSFLLVERPDVSTLKVK